MINEEDVAGMGLTFFCNSMVEGLFYLVRDRTVSDKLRRDAHWAVAEFQSLGWPFGEGSVEAFEYVHREAPYVLFDSNQNIKTFETLAEHLGMTPETARDYFVEGLKLVTSDRPYEDRAEKARELQKTFGVFGDLSFFAGRDSQRRLSLSTL